MNVIHDSDNSEQEEHDYALQYEMSAVFVLGLAAMFVIYVAAWILMPFLTWCTAMGIMLALGLLGALIGCWRACADLFKDPRHEYPNLIIFAIGTIAGPVSFALAMYGWYKKRHPKRWPLAVN